MKHKITKRKFYNKWDYKISLHGKELRFLRYFPLQKLPDLSEDQGLIVKIYNFLSNLKTDAYAKRIERNTLDIYVNDKDLYDLIRTEFSSVVRLTCSPDANLLNRSGKTIMANKFPYDRYRYKVYLKPHRLIDSDDRKQYLDWLESQIPRVCITESVKKWFHRTSWNWDRRYMYVEDDATLLILKMKCADALGSIYTYELIDK